MNKLSKNKKQNFPKNILEGVWEATGFICGDKTVQNQEVFIRNDNKEFVAQKIRGDPCVPNGSLAFRGFLPSNLNFDFRNKYPCDLTVGNPSSPSSSILKICKIDIIDQNNFKILSTRNIIFKRQNLRPIRQIPSSEIPSDDDSNPLKPPSSNIPSGDDSNPLKPPSSNIPSGDDSNPLNDGEKTDETHKNDETQKNKNDEKQEDKVDEQQEDNVDGKQENQKEDKTNEKQGSQKEKNIDAKEENKKEYPVEENQENSRSNNHIHRIPDHNLPLKLFNDQNDLANDRIIDNPQKDQNENKIDDKQENKKENTGDEIQEKSTNQIQTVHNLPSILVNDVSEIAHGQTIDNSEEVKKEKKNHYINEDDKSSFYFSKCLEIEDKEMNNLIKTNDHEFECQDGYRIIIRYRPQVFIMKRS